MKKTIVVYWPLAIVLSLAAAALIHICGDVVARAHQAPLAADEVTAQLARAISFGLVDDEAVAAIKPSSAPTGMSSAATTL
ncbi:hypothetical protein [Paraburkholderia sp.]|uniref:hypothetical protein n=1 Tax=Paraburkholderia sp. TaxID=1926495 RepID=UPI0023A68617|nr:hypothetical protein [Paraburkholderia sp.]MDE1183917.1 hypothetical protein [Paraburkholderia sp.]